jgi:antibiotic biosynthesis monooxygenase (ABM) superfamily enzyme
MASYTEIPPQSDNQSAPVALVIQLKPRPGADGEFSRWHAKAATAAAEIDGFVSSEVNAPSSPGNDEWSIVHHFRNAAALSAWRATEGHARLMAEARSLADTEGDRSVRESEVAEATLASVVTEVVTTSVKPGKERDYRAWAERIHQAEAQFPGYRGSFLQPPASSGQHYWTTLVRFATPQQLDAWLSSGERMELLREHDALVRSWEHHRLPGSFAGWFPPDPVSGQSPPSWKQSMLVILMLFPIVVLELRFLTPVIAGLRPAAMGTFIGNVISVFLLAWPFMPIAIAAMNWWLMPRDGGTRWVNAAGVALLFALYAGEIAALSRLL